MHIRSSKEDHPGIQHPDYRLYTRMPDSHGGLLAGSLIDTPAGLQPIEALIPGDHVWGFSHEQKVPARILRVFRADAPAQGQTGHRLGETAVLSANTCLYWQGHWRKAGQISLASASLTGPVYDLLTDTQNFYCQGVLIGTIELELKTEPLLEADHDQSF